MQETNKAAAKRRERSSWLKTSALAVLATYWVALVVGTHWPRPPEMMGLGASDKTLHLAAYFGLAVLVWLNWRLRRAASWRSGMAIVGLLVLFGALDEVTQPPFGRDAQFADWLADGAGVLGGVLVCLVAASMVARNSPRRGDV